jgi:18S rRNA (guanine1575-N7)-methyltransferase
VLSELGHTWTGVDVSPSMLEVARDSGCAGDLIVCDIGEGLPFRPGSFDGAISISTVQWLCTAFQKSHNPRTRIRRFFETLYASLRKGTRAVLQLYPEDKHQLDMLTTAALRAGFAGGIVVDYPNSTRAKKVFLVLSCGASSAPAPTAIRGEGPPQPPAAGAGEAPSWDHVQLGARVGAARKRAKTAGARGDVKRKDWILAKKERRRAQGKKTANDSKYTGRSRGPKF